MHAFITTLSLIACTAVISCSPVQVVSRYGFQATLTDADTNRPISGIPTKISIDGTKFDTATSTRGEVEVAPDREPQLSWLGGPARINHPDAKIIIEPIGYQTTHIYWHRYLPDRDSADTRYPEESGIIDLGRLQLKQR
ncbi:hypothetical protein NT6N_04320 [Oceaniferula spumae]|uniref:Carboxypeptidase regulatory-like domain-containing protein n=1 Tax=Oceaniferula spumae TaxID=2979115 RepID=A0AAT9FHD5_9BACT